MFIVPLILMAIALSWHSAPLLALSFLVQMAGLIIERWTFFADATHPQNFILSGDVGLEENVLAGSAGDLSPDPN